MKKMLLLGGLVSTIAASAQTVTFDDLTLAPNSHYSGSDGAGQFTSGGITFPNSYDAGFMYWSGGFIYSNTTDVTTAGYTNDFSAYAGGGADGSANYAVNYGSTTLDLGVDRVIESIALTNNTYAALSMLNGDAYGKQFGSVNNAQGTPDGTNGADYFRLLIIGKNANDVVIDTVVFYLADYRFSNNSEDYVVDSWETVDLSSLGAVRYLDFEYESSDVGGFGINTPVYFAMDNLKYGFLGTQVNTLATAQIFPNPATAGTTIKSEAGKMTVTNATGAVVFEGVTNGTFTLDCTNWTAGYYLVTVANQAGVSRGAVVKQ